MITCAIFARNITDLYAVFQKKVKGNTVAADTSEVFLTICVQMVNATQQASGGHLAHSAAVGCATAVVKIPIQIKRSGGKYSVQFDATPTKAGKTPLAVSCRATGTHTRISVRPRSRKKKLYQLVPRLDIGFSNPTNRPVKIHSVFRFSR